MRFIIGGAVASVLLFASAGAALAHAELALADPAAGVGLAQAPAAVIIKFTEPLNLDLSHIDVLDTQGVEVGQGPTEAVPGDPFSMRRALGFLTVGQYAVQWTSVSTLDGHVLQGTYTFAVGAAAPPGTTLQAGPLDSEGPLGLIGEFVALVGLTVWVGSVLLRSVALRAGLTKRRLGRISRAAPAMAAGGTALALASTALVASGSLAAIGGAVSGPSGTYRLLILVAGIIGVVVGPRFRPAVVVLAGGALVAEAASGHAATSVAPVVATLSFALHLGSVSVWLFALVVAFAVPRTRQALAVLTPYAVAAAAATALSGLVNALFVLDSPADLFDTGYGEALLAKMAAFMVMVGMGLIHFTRRQRPTPSEAPLREPVRIELSVALLAIALATLLVGFPDPPHTEAVADQLAGADPVLTQLATRPAVSVAGASGPFVVGLTILPPVPGPIELRVQVLGVEAGDALRDVQAQGQAGDAHFDVALTPCGLGCFAGMADASAGVWTFSVSMSSNRGAVTVSTTVPLPVPDGTADLARATASMESLQAAHLDEQIRSYIGGPLFDSVYDFQAPDRMSLSIGPNQRIIIGQEDYSRPSGTATWQVLPYPAPGFSWPIDYYRSFWAGAEAVRVVGQDTVDGVPSLVVTFIRPDIPAWFRLWVGIGDGLVRQQEMLAQGHIMSDAYSGWNGSLQIAAPR